MWKTEDEPRLSHSPDGVLDRLFIMSLCLGCGSTRRASPYTLGGYLSRAGTEIDEPRRAREAEAAQPAETAARTGRGDRARGRGRCRMRARIAAGDGLPGRARR